VFFSLSLWRDADALAQFNRLAAHVWTARWIIPRIYSRRRQRLELWSTQWVIRSTSTNLNWGDLDWHALVASVTAKAP
jgi:hypothetical protein